MVNQIKSNSNKAEKQMGAQLSETKNIKFPMITKADYQNRINLYRLLSRLFRVETDRALLDSLKTLAFPDALAPAESSTAPALYEGYSMLRAYLDSCDDKPDMGKEGGAQQKAVYAADPIEDLAVDFATVFLAAGSADGSAAIPCESVYTGKKKIFMQEAWEEVTELYKEYGLDVNEEFGDIMADHIAAELDFMANLIEIGFTTRPESLTLGSDAAATGGSGPLVNSAPLVSSTNQGTLEAQKSFLENHLLNWVPDFVSDIDRYARVDFYKAVGRIALGFLQLELSLVKGLLAGLQGESAIRQAPSYSVRQERFQNILALLQEKYRVFGPKRLPKRGPRGTDLIRYGEINALTEIEYKEKSHFSAKEVFYPISQTLLYFNGENCTEKELPEDKDIILIARACDLNGIERLDNIFLNNGNPDLYYARMRKKLKLILLECEGSFENCFCVSMGTNSYEDYSGAMRIDDICALFEIRDEDLAPFFKDEVPIDFSPKFVSSNERAADLPKIESREQLGEICKSEYWNQYDSDCIGCGGCNSVCPTCSCFDTVDILYNETSTDGERRRVWSACMLEDFTATAGGGRARKTQGANMRFKVLHKVYDYRLRFGGKGNMCVGCGRCIDRCPKDIDYLDAVNGLTAHLKAKEEA